jgi:hypothetical protein
MTFEEAIKGLGETPEQVTAKLRELGIKGYRQSATLCPIAKYLNTCGFPHVSVCSAAKWYKSSNVSASAEETIYLPHDVQRWIRQFDDGEHAEFSW